MALTWPACKYKSVTKFSHMVHFIKPTKSLLQIPFLRNPALTTVIWRIFVLFPTSRLFQRSQRVVLWPLQPSVRLSAVQPISIRPQTWTQHWDIPAQSYQWLSTFSRSGKCICSNSAWPISCLWHNGPYHSSQMSWTCFLADTVLLSAGSLLTSQTELRL